MCWLMAQAGDDFNVTTTERLVMEGEFVATNSVGGDTYIQSIGGPIVADADGLIDFLADEFVVTGEGGVEVHSPSGPISFETDDTMSATAEKVP